MAMAWSASYRAEPAVMQPGSLAARLVDRWRDLVARRRTLTVIVDAAAGGVSMGDEEVFALQCAEAIARVEFETAMEAWASRP